MPLHLDHIILLIPYSTLQKPPLWLTDNFTLTPGGRHADNRTENKLICFKDGSYIELISFINDDPQLREGHWWDKPFGIVDFAFTSSERAEKNFGLVNGRLVGLEPLDFPRSHGQPKDALFYDAPIAGSRVRDDGEVVKWDVTFPGTGFGFQRGEVPFFCHDVTERGLRVPGGEEHVTHPCGAMGVEELSVYVPEEEVERLSEVYAMILDKATLFRGGEKKMRRFEMEPLEGGGAGVGICVKGVGVGEVKRGLLEERGVLLGDLVVKVEGGEGKRVRIDGMGEEFGWGGLWRE